LSDKELFGGVFDAALLSVNRLFTQFGHRL